MEKIYRFAIVIFVAQLLFGCRLLNTPVAESLPTMKVTTEKAVTVPLSSSPIPPTKTVIAPNSPVKPTSTEPLIIDDYFIPTCSGNGDPISPPAEFNLPGAIIYQRDENEIYTVGGHSLIQSLLPISGTYGIVALGLSPDGQWLAYAPKTYQSTVERWDENKAKQITGTVVLETPAIFLLSAKGERAEYKLPLDGMDFKIDENHRWLADAFQEVFGFPNSYWVNDHLLHLDLFYEDSEDPYSYGFVPVKFYDLSKNNWFDEPTDQLERFYEAGIDISPDMSRILYDSKSKGVILQNQNKVQIWSDDDFFAFRNAFIDWSPDSSWVSVHNEYANPEQRYFMLISRNGDKTINLNVKWISDNFHIGSVSWSTDNRYLAFIGNYDLPSLFVYDIQEQNAVSSCPLRAFEEYPPNLLWSPDNGYIAISAPVPDMPLQVLNLSTGEVYEIARNAHAIGWSTAFLSEQP